MSLVKIAPSTEAYDTVHKYAKALPDGSILYSCPIHGYMWGAAVQTPQNSCEYCWVMFYEKLVACTPPHLQEELLDNLERAMRNATDDIQKGTFDLDLPMSPETEVILDPDDFKT